MQKIIKVPDMHCENCVRRIAEALKVLNINAEIDLKAQTVTVEGCEQCHKRAFDEIYDLGFTPQM